MANKSMPIFLVPIHFIDLHLYFGRMAKPVNDELRRGMFTALLLRTHSLSDFVVLLEFSRIFIARCLADLDWLYTRIWLPKTQL